MPKQWKLPPIIKVYEALGCIADKRIKTKGNQAEVISSDGSKTYTVTYDPRQNAIMSNDNGSYWQGYLGYPAIAFLMKKKMLPYDSLLAKSLRGIPWKTWNTEFKNDYSKTQRRTDKQLEQRGIKRSVIHYYCKNSLAGIEQLKLQQLGIRTRPSR